MKLAEFLLNCSDEFNGHKQTDLGEISMKDAVNLLGELKDACEDIADIFSLELYRDGSFSIVQKGYWNRGEHPSGHTDRLICSGMIDFKREEDTMSHTVPIHTAEQQQRPPTVDDFVATFRCESNGVVGTTTAKIHSVSRHDDGVIEVVIDHWPQQPAAGEEIMVNAAHDVYTLPLQPSGLDGKGPRFVVHVPGPEQTAPQPAEQPATDVDMLVEHERKLFEARMRRVAPGVNLEMIGDKYNDLDTQWKFELWLDRAALVVKGVK